MYQGRDSIQRAGILLRDPHLTPRGRLRQSATLIWSALYFYRDGPLAIQLQVGIIQRLILRHGPVDQTVEALSDSEVVDTISTLIEFTQRFELHSPSDRPPASSHPQRTLVPN